MGRKIGLEPTTSGTTNQRSNQLSYIRHDKKFFIRLFFLCQEKNSSFLLFIREYFGFDVRIGLKPC